MPYTMVCHGVSEQTDDGRGEAELCQVWDGPYRSVRGASEARGGGQSSRRIRKPPVKGDCSCTIRGDGEMGEGGASLFGRVRSSCWRN